MAVTLGNMRAGQAALFAHHLLALAGAGNPLAGFVDHAYQPDSIADCADTHLQSSVAQPAGSRCGAGLARYCGKAVLARGEIAYNRSRAGIWLFWLALPARPGRKWRCSK